MRFFLLTNNPLIYHFLMKFKFLHRQRYFFQSKLNKTCLIFKYFRCSFWLKFVFVGVYFFSLGKPFIYSFDTFLVNETRAPQMIPFKCIFIKFYHVKRMLFFLLLTYRRSVTTARQRNIIALKHQLHQLNQSNGCRCKSLTS